ncbi:NTP transferase domain-containing protein [Hymenobacter taeanensis]|uniref:NTP transferase domain-containing protein n=1 Tax=Hymenobacter taeanensis TaxID=2735321 RepID=A0A6M6BEJ3_9BACT|nr:MULTISPECIES: sugar phosphate nucleotidyltransferase [Hymenobacter]QJX46278.1 NTP transferase domain-containing protein [Hymenobacter taeanensis]UOQ80134.1 sugar phosphate nucleotidyltransferase [Hymenobacter sp. 5414T-23]
MKIIVPMAGMGKRMRPHTLTVPKPLIPIAGKPIVQRLVEDIAKVCGEQVEEVAFIIGRFGAEVEKSLVKIAESVGAKGTIHYQDEPLGTAHAILCAQSALDGHVVVAFADTLFKADFTLDTSVPGTIWVQQVDDPKPFGVVKLNEEGQITDFVEKPQEFVSDLAIIGIYYFQDGEYLRQELQYLLDNNILDKGEFQLTNALENMKNKGTKFVPGRVTEWLDCGNKDATVFTNQRYLEYLQERGENLVAESATVTNSVLIPPVYVGEGVVITDSVVGPHVSLGNQSNVRNSVVSNSIVQQSASVLHANITNSMIGNFATVASTPNDLSLGDYNTLRV